MHSSERKSGLEVKTWSQKNSEGMYLKPWIEIRRETGWELYYNKRAKWRFSAPSHAKTNRKKKKKT